MSRDTSINPALVPFDQSHVTDTYEWVKNPDLQRDFLLRGEISWEGHVKYFEQLLADPSQTCYAITYEGDHIGNCGFKHIDTLKGRAELWIYLGNYKHHGKGIGNSATRLLLAKGFNDLSLRLIYLHVAQFNLKAATLYERLGFTISVCDGCAGWDNRPAAIIHMELPRNRWLQSDNSGVQ